MPTIIPALPAQPTATPITNIVTIQSDNWPWPNYDVAAGTTLYATTLPTLLQTSGAGYLGTLTNGGTMWVEAGAEPWALVAKDVSNVVNNGLMVIHAGAATTVNTDGFLEASLDNRGQIYVINEGLGDASAVTGYVGGNFVNNGLVAVQALNGFAYGFVTNNESSLNNQAGGQILVEGMGAIAFATSNGGSALHPTQINNAGTIQAVSLDPELLSFGLWLGGFSNDVFNVTNSGSISADVAIYGTDDTATTMGTVVQLVHNLAGGTISGLIYLQRGNDLVENAGTINGWVDMGEGADTVDTSAGVINGIVDLGWGNDVFKGGSAADFAAGGRNDDNMQGGGGNDQLMGGGGRDVLIGGAGNDGLFGEWDNDRIVTAGGDFVDGGDGDDRIELGDYTFEYVTGGNGFDTLVLPGPGGVRTINLSSVLTEAAIAEIEQIELTGGKTVVIQASDVTAFTGGETTLRLTTTLTDRVKLVGAWTNQGNQTIDGVVWKTYASGGVTILVQGTGTVSTNATSEAGALDPFAGGDLAPIPGAGPLDFSSSVEILDRYELTAPITVQAYETLRAGTTGVVLSDWVGTAITNYGTIESINPLMAVTLDTNNIQEILNYGTIRAESSGGSAVAIYTDSFTDVENHGLIRASSGTGGAAAVYTCNLYNYSVIEASVTTGLAFGVSTWNGAVFENHASIAVSSGGLAPGSIGPAAFAVDLYNHGDALNAGTIIATAQKGMAKAVHISASSFTTLTNTGMIAAVSHAPDQYADVPDEISVQAYIPHASDTFMLINSGDIAGAVMITGKGTFSVENSGLIDGLIWLGAFEDYSEVTVQLDNSGHVTGDFRFDIAVNASNIQNSGQLDGAIMLGSANDTFDGDLGVQLGPISGGGGNDQIRGGVGAETISGNSGIDTLTGGAGADIFRDSAAGLNGDTITDFGAGDTIVISDASLAGFSFSLSGSTLTYTGGSLILTGGAASQIYASAAAGGGVQLSFTPPESVRNDFNGDGRSDVLWRSDAGEFSDWLANPNGGFVMNDAAAFANVPTNWHIAGTGDFNGDRYADVLWRSDAGQVSNWLGTSTGGFTNNDANAFASVPTNWHIVGTGDFNGDGRHDILWRSDAGQVSNWLGTTAGGFTNNDANAFASVPTNWHVVGTGDFNGDGQDDILWRSDSGQLSNWLGTEAGGWQNNDANAFASVPTNWHVVGAGDFNNDGYDDILWRSDAGQLSNWLGQANGGFANNDANAFASVPTNWAVVAVGDYNGDGFDDILWRNDSGQLSNWLGTETGGFTNNDANAFSSAPASWHVQPLEFLV